MAEAMADLVRSRRVLTMLGLHNLRSLVNRLGARALEPSGRAYAGGPAPSARPHLTVTLLGRNDAFAALPWAPHERRRMIGLVSPSGPRGITVAVDELRGALHVTASYHPGVFDARSVAAAVQGITQDVLSAG